jgi:hypothetical protein
MNGWNAPGARRSLARAGYSSLVAAATLLGCGAEADSDLGSTEAALGAGEPPLYFQTLPEYPNIDASNNNLANPSRGAASALFVRKSPTEYGDGTGSLAGASRASARLISNTVAAQSAPIFNSANATDMFWQWGQFLDHDFDLALTGTEAANIPVPAGDPFFDPGNTGTQVIPFSRSVFELIGGVRQQVNVITSYVDASNVYGSDTVRATTLRKPDGSGELATSPGDLLPFNATGLPNAGGTGPTLFLAGDERANEQVFLTVMHTLWVREHNSWARFFKSSAPYLTGDQVYLLARAMVAAEVQSITFNEFLPLLLGYKPLGDYAGYNSGVDASISNEFATAAYRFGHTLLSSSLPLLDAGGNAVAPGPLALRDSFFNPQVLINLGPTPFLRGLAGQRAQELDHMVVDDVRNFLFGPPGAGGLDLPSLNIQRGRDHGLADYNAARVALGLPARTAISQVSSNAATRARLQAAYSNVNEMDLWMTGLAEDHAPGAMVGETFRAILIDQFRRSRDGDRFYFERILPANLRTYARHTKLSTVIRRNTEATIFDLQHEVMALIPAAPSSVLGFESTQQWSSSAPLSLNTAYRTDGQRSLNVGGGGYRTLTSAVLPGSVVGGKREILVDVFVPENQPDPYYAGAVQTFLTCPSRQVFSEFVNQVELTDMPRGQFNTTVHAISTTLRNRLGSNPSDCRLTISLNANSTPTSYALDRLRFF